MGRYQTGQRASVSLNGLIRFLAVGLGPCFTGGCWRGLRSVSWPSCSSRTPSLLWQDSFDLRNVRTHRGLQSSWCSAGALGSRAAPWLEGRYLVSAPRWKCLHLITLSPCLCVCVHARAHFRCVWFFVILWTVACQAPLSMGFSRQEYWSGSPCLPLGDLLHSGIQPASLTSESAGKLFTTSATWGIVLIQGWNPGLLGYRQMLYHWANREAPTLCAYAHIFFVEKNSWSVSWAVTWNQCTLPLEIKI